MENIVNMICDGSGDFTPETLIGLLLFSMALECIGTVMNAVLKAGR